MVKKILFYTILVIVLGVCAILGGTMLKYKVSLPAAVQQLITPTGEVVRLTLINADNDQPIPGYENLTDGMTLNIATLPTLNLNIRAVTTGTVASVKFGYGAESTYNIDNKAPFALKGDADGDYFVWRPTPIPHHVKATPYPKDNAQGVAGKSYLILLNVVNTPPTGCIAISKEVYESNGTTPNSTVSGFTFKLNQTGAQMTTGTNGDIKFGNLPMGHYVVTELARSGYTYIYPKDGSLDIDVTKPTAEGCVHGTFKSKKNDVPLPPPVTPPAPPVTPTVGQITSLSLYNAETQTEITGFSTLGAVTPINLSSLPTRNLTIKANTTGQVQKVRFDLDSRTNFGSDDVAPFLMTDNAWTPSVGLHVVNVTPYTNNNGTLVAGSSTVIQLNVTDPAQVKPIVTISANPVSVANGGSATVTWTTSNATSCTASGDWSGSKPLSGTQVISNITQDKSLFLACTGNGSTVTNVAYIKAPLATAHARPLPLINGYSDVSPKSDSRVVYVSTTGNNENDGSTPALAVQTIAKAISLVRSGYPDQILLKKGDTWTDEPITLYTGTGTSKVAISGRSDLEKLVIGSYGTGERPTVVATTNSSALYIENGGRHIAIVGIHFKGSSLRGNGIDMEGVSGAGDVLIEDCFIERFRTGIDISAPDHTVTRPTDANVMKDITVRRSVIVDSYKSDQSAPTPAHPEGAYFYGVDGVIVEDNVFDNNGRKPDGSMGTQWDHNIYMTGMTWNVVVRGNIFSNAAGHGLQARSGGIVENNFFYKNPLHLSFGFVSGDGQITMGGVTGRVSNNVMIGTRQILGGAVPGNRGIGIQLANITQATVDHNIIAYNTDNTINPAFDLQPGSGAYGDFAIGIHNLTIENNVVYQWPNSFYINGFGANAARTKFTASNVVVQNNSFTGTVRKTSAYTTPASAPNRTALPTTPTLNPNFDAFIAGARQQSKDTWRPEYTAAAAIQTVKTGMGVQ